jgi:hypothetical protein
MVPLDGQIRGAIQEQRTPPQRGAASVRRPDHEGLMSQEASLIAVLAPEPALSNSTTCFKVSASGCW